MYRFFEYSSVRNRAYYILLQKIGLGKHHKKIKYMKATLEGILTFLSLDKASCKDAHLCDCYSSSSYTCTHSGGNYCGKYRSLEKTEPLKANNETSFVMIPAEPICIEN
jgi:hypothetical protein